MSHWAYEEVWSQVQRLQPQEQLQLLEALAGLLRRQIQPELLRPSPETTRTNHRNYEYED